MSTSEKVQFELGGEFEDKNFTSCFARSMAVNSQYKQTKSLDSNSIKLPQPGDENNKGRSYMGKPMSQLEGQDTVRMRRNVRSGSFDETRRFSHSSSFSTSRRTSLLTNRISEIPVENIVQQSKIETLQWQLKEVEKNRDMYKAVMKQVVTFLEKAHQNLELIGVRKNSKSTVPRSKSEHQFMLENSTNASDEKHSAIDDYLAFRDYTWGRTKKPELAPEEVPPEKLSQEAFRLLRTAQSLLSTQEPDLAQLTQDPETDIEFLAQLAKEFPQTPEHHRPQRTTSFSLSPKLIVPESEVKISTAFNRKLSLQLSEVRRHSSIAKFNHRNSGVDSARGSVAESDTEFLLHDTQNLNLSMSSSNSSSFCQKTKYKESEKSNSPPAGSISSVEDESGFSSMNSFQDVGLPLINSTMIEEVCPKNALLRSMIHNNTLDNTVLSLDTKKQHLQDLKLWQKDSTRGSHKRWHSTPIEDKTNATNTQQNMKVLWV